MQKSDVQREQRDWKRVFDKKMSVPKLTVFGKLRSSVKVLNCNHKFKQNAIMMQIFLKQIHPGLLPLGWNIDSPMAEFDYTRQKVATAVSENAKRQGFCILICIWRYDKILTPGWLELSKIWLRFQKSCHGSIRKCQRRICLDGNCWRIHTKSAFIEFQKSLGLTFTEVRPHHIWGKSSDVKEPTICHKSTTNILSCFTFQYI